MSSDSCSATCTHLKFSLILTSKLWQCCFLLLFCNLSILRFAAINVWACSVFSLSFGSNAFDNKQQFSVMHFSGVSTSHDNVSCSIYSTILQVKSPSHVSSSARRCRPCLLPAWSLLLWLTRQSSTSHWNHAALVQKQKKSGMLGKCQIWQTDLFLPCYCWTYILIPCFCFTLSIIEKGEENCSALIEAHKDCMRALGFKI